VLTREHAIRSQTTEIILSSHKIYKIKRTRATWIGHILRRNCLLKHVIEGKIEERIEVTKNEEEDISTYWMPLRKYEDTEHRKRKHQIALCGELALEEATDLS
jgi:hypothetical protein